MLSEHLNIEMIAEECPVCGTSSPRGTQIAQALQKTLVKVRAESLAVERVKPKLADYDREIREEVDLRHTELRRIDDQIQTWLGQTEEVRRLANLAQLAIYLRGRISYFLEVSAGESRQFVRDLSVLRAEVADLETRVDREAREVKLRHAEAKISQYASDALDALPTVAPCIGSDLSFSSRKPEVTVIEGSSGTVLRLPDIGSDQNYLAIHIALAFAFQRHFELVDAPVPGLLVFDQISRPYFPTRGEDADETEIAGREEDEDIQAMRKHIDFLFAEVERRTDLQVLLIEHAYFADDPRYVASTRERWTRASGKALVPLDWPTRDELALGPSNGSP